MYTVLWETSVLFKNKNFRVCYKHQLYPSAAPLSVLAGDAFSVNKNKEKNINCYLLKQSNDCMNTWDARLCSRCRICTSSRVTDMAVLSFPLLQLVIRIPWSFLHSWKTMFVNNPFNGNVLMQKENCWINICTRSSCISKMF